MKVRGIFLIVTGANLVVLVGDFLGVCTLFWTIAWYLMRLTFYSFFSGYFYTLYPIEHELDVDDLNDV